MKREVKTSSDATTVNVAASEAVAGASVEETAPPTSPVGAGDGPADAAARAEAARSRAAQFMAERRYAEARKALEEADTIETPAAATEAESGKKLPHRVLTAMRSQLQRKPR